MHYTMGMELKKYERIKFHRMRRQTLDYQRTAMLKIDPQFLRRDIDQDFFLMTYRLFPYEEFVVRLWEDIRSFEADKFIKLPLEIKIYAVQVLRNKIHHSDGFEKNLTQFLKGVLYNEWKKYIEKEGNKKDLTTKLNRMNKETYPDLVQIEKINSMDKIDLDVYKKEENRNGKDDMYAMFYEKYKDM